MLKDPNILNNQKVDNSVLVTNMILPPEGTDLYT